MKGVELLALKTPDDLDAALLLEPTVERRAVEQIHHVEVTTVGQLAEREHVDGTVGVGAER